MIIKKLAVPLINDKILPQSEYCYIATTSISEAGFDFIRSRIPPKCKMEIVTGLDGLTSPGVLKRIWRHYQERMLLKIYTKNFFHANLYIFDLPFRKTVAFVGSGDFTLGGLKDSEELFYKITDAREVEALKSWFTGYYEFSEPLTENLIQEYEAIYPSLKQHAIAIRQEKEQVIALTGRGFNWDSIRFKNQFFTKEDFLLMGNSQAPLETPEAQAARIVVHDKFLSLHELIKDQLSGYGLYSPTNMERVVNSLRTVDHPQNKLRSMWMSYGRQEAELQRYYPDATLEKFLRMLVILTPRELGCWLMVGRARESKDDREHFRKQMEEPSYRSLFLKLLSELGAGYWIEIAGDKKPVESFQAEDILWEFTKADDWRYYTFVIGKNYSPGDADISKDNIASAILNVFKKLLPLYQHIKDKSFENKR
jgi:hypothetical protein